MLQRFRDRLQLDGTTAYAIGTRLWQAFSGPITILLIIRSLSLPEQGVYYGIVTIVGIQAYFELGLLNVLVSHSGHEYAAMRKASGGNSTMEPDATNPGWIAAAARMRDLTWSSLRWFGFASLLYVVSALAFGWYALADSEVPWQGPLAVIIPVAAVSVALAPALSILEGAGCRDLIYRFRFYQMTIGSVVVWVALASGLKLWALVLASGVQSILAAYITFVEKADFFRSLHQATNQASDFSWRQHVLPMQWRVALIGLAFHFATQFFTIIVLMFHSDADAAPLGMTLTVTTAVQMLALVWVQTQFPVVAAHHGAGDREKAGTIWRHTAVLSTSMLILTLTLLTFAIACLPMLGMGLEQRFIAPWQVAVLGIGCLANHIAAVQGFYVMSMRANPLLRASLIGALTTGAAVWIGGYFFSTTGVIVGYTAAMSLVLVPAHTLAYLKFRKPSSPS